VYGFISVDKRKIPSFNDLYELIGVENNTNSSSTVDKCGTNEKTESRSKTPIDSTNTVSMSMIVVTKNGLYAQRTWYLISI
jgi:hypothetical protein